MLVATNAFAPELVPDLDLVPGRGQVLVTEPLPDLHLPGTFHYDQGYYYFRQVNQRVLLGGGRNLDFDAEQTTAPGLTPLVQERLEELLRTVIRPGRPQPPPHRLPLERGYGLWPGAGAHYPAGGTRAVRGRALQRHGAWPWARAAVGGPPN